MTNDLPLIALCGVAQAGKNHIANLLRDEVGFLPWGLANALKFSCYASKKNKWSLEEYFLTAKGPELRRFLQLSGTEEARDVYGAQYWVRQAEGFRFIAKYDLKAPGVTIFDVRFPDEAQWVRDSGGVLLKVVRDGAGLSGTAGQHRSEIFVEEIQADGIIENHDFPGEDILLSQLKPFLRQLGVK